MEELFKNESKTIKVYLGNKQILDPYEKNIQLTELPPLPIRAIVTDLIASQSQWKLVGIVTNKTKEIIIEKKYRSLIEKSYKIEVDGDFYNGWKINGRMQIREEGNYCRIYIYIKKS